MSEITNKIITIIGLSSVLGEATALRLAKQGAKLMLAALEKRTFARIR